MGETPPPSGLAEFRKDRKAEVQGLLDARAQVDALSQALALLERTVRRLGLHASSDAVVQEAAGEVLDMSSETLRTLQNETNRSFESLRQQVARLQEDIEGGLVSASNTL